MSNEFHRRELLKSGLGAAGLLLTGGLAGVRAAERPGTMRSMVADRSAAAPSLPVGIQRAASYDPQPLRQAMDRALELIGGVRKLVEGKTVTVKINVTGGPGTLAGLPGYRTYHVHPNVVAALCGALADAGARRIVVVESQYSPKPPEEVLAGGGWDVPRDPRGRRPAGHVRRHPQPRRLAQLRAAEGALGRFPLPGFRPECPL